MFPIRDNVPSRRAPFFCWALIAANCWAFAREMQIESRMSEVQFLRWMMAHGVVPRFFFDPRAAFDFFGPMDLGEYGFGQVASIFSSMFLHGGLFHLVTNMICLWVFGDNVEDRFGHFTFLVFYLVGGAAAAGLHVFTNPMSAVPTIGASGAIAAVMGAYLMMFPFARILTLVPIFCLVYFIDIPAIVFLAFWFFLQFFSGLGALAGAAAEPVAWWAHVGGFGFGVIAALVLDRKGRRTNPPRYVSRPRVRRRNVIDARSYRVRVQD